MEQIFYIPRKKLSLLLKKQAEYNGFKISQIHYQLDVLKTNGPPCIQNNFSAGVLYILGRLQTNRGGRESGGKYHAVLFSCRFGNVILFS